MAVILASGFIDWIFVNFREYSIRSQFGHIQITRPGYRQMGAADPFAYLLPTAAPAFHEISAQPLVSVVAPRLYFSGLISRDDATLSFIGEGVDPDKERSLSTAATVSSGRSLAVDDPAGAILGDGLAANLGAKPGDALVLLVTTASGAVNAVDIRVRGTFYTVNKPYDDHALQLPLVTARRLLRVDGEHVWIVLLRDTDRTAAMLADFRKEGDYAGLEFTPWWELADFYNKTVKLFSRQLDVVRFIVGLIIVLSISNTMVMSVLERTWEIGTCMALGVRRRQILLQFLLEGLLLGIVGGLCGVVLGGGLAALLSAIGIPMPPPPGMSHGFVGGILFTPALAAGAFALGVSTTLVASFYPARRASRLPIVDALRHNH